MTTWYAAVPVATYNDEQNQWSVHGNAFSGRQEDGCKRNSCFGIAGSAFQAQIPVGSTLLPEDSLSLVACQSSVMPALYPLCMVTVLFGASPRAPMVLRSNAPGQGMKALTRKFAFPTKQFFCCLAQRLVAVFPTKLCGFLDNLLQ